MNKFTELEATLSSGDKLVLALEKDVTYAQYERATIWKLFYAEKAPDPMEPGKVCFFVTGSEHFAESQTELALTAFQTRLTTNPFKPCGLGMSLDSLLTRKAA